MAKETIKPVEETKYLRFYLTHNTGKTAIYAVRNKANEELGDIRWNGGWRKYVFRTLQSNSSVIFDTQCLNDIVRFIDSLMEDRRKQSQLKP